MSQAMTDLVERLRNENARLQAVVNEVWRIANLGHEAAYDLRGDILAALEDKP